MVPYAPQDEGPTLKRWIACSEKWTSMGVSASGSAPSSPRPGAATKKSSRWSSPPAVCTSMKPPAPGPVSGDSATNDISTHATAASTALPPSRSTSAPACAVTGWPAATTPFMAHGIRPKTRAAQGRTERGVLRTRATEDAAMRRVCGRISAG